MADNGIARDAEYKGKALQHQFTVEDEGVFTTPWSAAATYRRPSVPCSGQRLFVLKTRMGTTTDRKPRYQPRKSLSFKAPPASACFLIEIITPLPTDAVAHCAGRKEHLGGRPSSPARAARAKDRVLQLERQLATTLFSAVGGSATPAARKASATENRSLFGAANSRRETVSQRRRPAGIFGAAAARSEQQRKSREGNYSPLST
jgi:hypothetical protein